MLELDLQKKEAKEAIFSMYYVHVYFFKGGLISESFFILKQMCQSEKLSENKSPLLMLSFSRV